MTVSRAEINRRDGAPSWSSHSRDREGNRLVQRPWNDTTAEERSRQLYPNGYSWSDRVRRGRANGVDRPLANRKVFWFRFDELLGIDGDESEGVPYTPGRPPRNQGWIPPEQSAIPATTTTAAHLQTSLEPWQATHRHAEQRTSSRRTSHRTTIAFAFFMRTLA